ncbi:MAG: Crp/Fnr family transcriptional regulator [Flavobacteriales bacterium]|nr:Crp/Fnr family transcriptional regulator [Flavobacteriales bacterium]
MEKCLGNCVGCLKVNYSLFSDLSEKELELLNKGRNKLYFNKGDIIFKEGALPKGLYCLNQGKVKLVKRGKIEEEFIVGLHKPVDFLGFDNLMSTSPYSNTAIALEDVSICVIKKENLFKVISKVPELGHKIISYFSKRLIEQNERMLILTQTKMESRLAYTLIDLVNFYGYEPDGKTLAIDLKRKELASLSSMNTANVIRILSFFNKYNIVKTKLRKIQILNFSVLEQMIE